MPVPSAVASDRYRPHRPRGVLRRPRIVIIALVATGLLAACTGGSPDGPGSDGAGALVLRASATLPDAAATVVPDGSAAETTLAVSRALFAEAPVAVLVEDDPALLAPAASVAVTLGAPVLLAEPGVALADEVERLGSTDLIVLGDADEALAGLSDDVRTYAVDDPGAPDALADLGIAVGKAQDVAPADLTAAVAALDRPAPALLLARGADDPDPAPADAAPADATAAPRESAAPTGDATPGGWQPYRFDPQPSATGTPSGRPDRRAADSDGPRGAAGLGSDGTAVEPPDAPEAAAVLVDLAADTAGRSTAAVATARAAGVPVVDVPGGDPRATSASVQALTGVHTVIALGSSFGDAHRLGPRAATAATGVELPGGGQLVFPARASTGGPGKKYVALYGTPGTPALGVLGEQDVPATLARAQQTAAQYDALTEDTVVPMLEIIATIASAGPEADNSYSRPRSVDDLRPLVEAAGEAGMAVVLDLQPGRTDFVTQAQQYADLLAYPHVGLALDPEWRLAPDQVHLRQIGSVGIDEVNATADWLARFTRERHLPQKVFVLHQFSLRMIADRDRLDTSHDELAVLIHADGQGSQPAKAGTWAALRQGAPDVHWGWKNFYDEDTPMLDPTQTYQVQPTPDLVTYQ